MCTDSCREERQPTSLLHLPRRRADWLGFRSVENPEHVGVSFNSDAVKTGMCALSFRRVVGADAIALVASLLRGQDDRWPIFLLGAGASFRSGVPRAAESFKQIARIVDSERKLQGQRSPERVRPTEWEPWLLEQPWFNRAATSLAEDFPTTVEHLLVPAELRKRVLLDTINPRDGLSSSYGTLADLVMRGLVRTILTTNFDPCLPDALQTRHPNMRHIAEVNRGPEDYGEFDGETTPSHKNVAV